MCRFRSEEHAEGFSLLELVMALALTGMMLALATFNFRALEHPARDASQELMGFFKQARARALASTHAYTIKAGSATSIIATYGTTCNAAQTTDPKFRYTLPNGARLDDVAWSICYSTRGIADSSIDVPLSDTIESHTVQVALGGGVRVL